MPSPDLGNFPQWLSGAAAILGLGWAYITFGRDRTRRRSETAESVFFNGSGAPVRLTVDNLSKEPIYLVTLFIDGEPQRGSRRVLLPGDKKTLVPDDPFTAPAAAWVQFRDPRGFEWKRDLERQSTLVSKPAAIRKRFTRKTLLIGIVAFGLAGSFTAGFVLYPESKAHEQPTYLEIKELGVRIRLTDDIKDVIYNYDSFFLSRRPDPQQVGVSSQALLDLSDKCEPSTGRPLGTIGKTKNPNLGFGILKPNNETVFRFGEYYIFYLPPQSSCGGSQGVETELHQQQSFQQAFRTVQAN